ncbi:Tab2/Atab2 family RNA-binding protein [Thermocoleostomius sinensis]|uniref:Tab2/Atab2 family RNA-binding protein n=1 Tax=Thermocoleostomius sinensis A174 TaxID=2016057 RepID=A0A9E8ZK52_9CYAN|nr:Tab2/Atab2 family RNA-binding protein [Thermocoleostomius sinensis]WAL62693.1 Tab2/Atab2 family RNA-binding protein [Thermocoleostomius sinensis A174]
MAIVWELDFYSRPVLDENQKKLWELLVCESPTDIRTNPDSLFRYSEFCASTEVNSVRLRQALEQAIAQAPKPPDRIRFFRRQMNNMITKACEDAGISVYPSRRTLALNRWIQQRLRDVYPTLPNYQASSNPSVNLPASPPQPLPDALRGEKWMLVTLPASALAEMPEWDISFGEAFPLELAEVPPDTAIPGLIIFSSRAMPLAAWMSGLELAFLKLNPEPPAKLVLETGANDAWILANVASAPLQIEAQNFEQAKEKANWVHFVAVQSDPNAESFAGFWLLQELNLLHSA